MTDKLFMKLKLTTLLAFVACAFISCAATFELARNPKNVLYVSPAGNDATAWYGTSNRPWGTIGAAINAARVGDKILVAPGTYTGDGLSTLTLPDQVTLRGSGTNNTFTDISDLKLGHSNEVCFLSFTNRQGLIGQGQIRVYANSGQNFLHDLVVLSQNQILTLGSLDGNGGASRGWNVISNCTFDTKAWGLDLSGTNYFYNCAVYKLADNPSITQGSRMVQIHSGLDSHAYFVNCTLLSTTNCAGDSATNSVLVWNGGNAGSEYFISHSILFAPSTSLQFYGIAGNTNYVGDTAWDATRTNALAVVKSITGQTLPQTNSMAWKFMASWQARINTNAQFLLPAPPTNSP